MGEGPSVDLDAEVAAIKTLAERNFGITRPFADNLRASVGSGTLPVAALPLIREALDRCGPYRHAVHGQVHVAGGPGGVGISNSALGLAIFLHN